MKRSWSSSLYNVTEFAETILKSKRTMASKTVKYRMVKAWDSEKKVSEDSLEDSGSVFLGAEGCWTSCAL